MAVIAVGVAAADKNGFTTGKTYLNSAAANLTGKLTQIQVWMHEATTDLTVGVYYLTGTLKWKCRASQLIGVVSAGSVQTKNVDLDIVAGDKIGCYLTTGSIDRAEGAGTGAYRNNSELKDAGDEGTFYDDPTYDIALYGIGATPALGPPASMAAVMGALGVL